MHFILLSFLIYIEVSASASDLLMINVSKVSPSYT